MVKQSHFVGLALKGLRLLDKKDDYLLFTIHKSQLTQGWKKGREGNPIESRYLKAEVC